jgi:DNA primase
MRYPPALLDEIRARLPVSEVVGRRVKLKKAGREWRGLSPFNAEKTPSFYVNDQKGFYHCFSSGKHGDIFRFLMETEGLPFPEAVERLAAEANVPLPKLSQEVQVQERRRQDLHGVMELAASFFEKELRGRRGGKARDYLARRGLSDEVQARFRLGYAPADRYALRDFLAGEDVPAAMMIEAGLLVTGEDVSVPYDRFRDRVMFPITDLRGRVVAFGGRALQADVPAKYLNSPDTPLFQKGSLLYNAHTARKSAHERGSVIAVEGYIDVIAMSLAGFPNCVAPLGTALTEEQLGLLWRMADEPVLCFDGDKAGRRAAFRALDIALPLLPAGKSLRFAMLPEGQDPDDLARSGGAGAVERVIGAARPLVDVLWARETEMGERETPEQKAGLERRLHAAVAQIKDEVLQRYYRDEIRRRLFAENRPARPSARPQRGAPGRPGAPVSSRIPPGYKLSAQLLGTSSVAAGSDSASAIGIPPREAAIIAVFVAHPALLHDHAEELAHMELASDQTRALRRVLVDCAAEADIPDPEVVRARISRAGLSAVAESVAARMVPSLGWMLDPHADKLRLEDALRQAIILHRRAYSLHSELRAAERALAEDDSEANLAWLREIQSQLSSVEGAEADLDKG